MEELAGVRRLAAEPNRRAILVCSHCSGGAVPPDEIVAALEQAEMGVVDVLEVADLGETPMGPVWESQGVGNVIAAGGDGTVGSVATHIAGTRLCMGILPLGTGNNAARSMQIPLELAGSAGVLATGEVVAIDVGEVVDAAGRRARFLHAAMLGISADFARIATDEERRERLGALNYPLAFLESLFSLQTVQASITFSDGREIEAEALQIAAMNLPHMMGSAIPIRMPGVDASDGRLSFFLARSLTEVERVEARWARITCASRRRRSRSTASRCSRRRWRSARPRSRCASGGPRRPDRGGRRRQVRPHRRRCGRRVREGAGAGPGAARIRWWPAPRRWPRASAGRCCWCSAAARAPSPTAGSPAS
ncbi:MAG: diacylglycerol kinase family protein [Myxococcota bacterium]